MTINTVAFLLSCGSDFLSFSIREYRLASPPLHFTAHTATRPPAWHSSSPVLCLPTSSAACCRSAKWPWTPGSLPSGFGATDTSSKVGRRAAPHPNIPSHALDPKPRSLPPPTLSYLCCAHPPVAPRLLCLQTPAPLPRRRGRRAASAPLCSSSSSRSTKSTPRCVLMCVCEGRRGTESGGGEERSDCISPG